MVPGGQRFAVAFELGQPRFGVIGCRISANARDIPTRRRDEKTAAWISPSATAMTWNPSVTIRDMPTACDGQIPTKSGP